MDVCEAIYSRRTVRDGVTGIPFDEESKHLKAVLNIPEDCEIPCYIALEYPDKNAKPIKQHSINVEEKMHFNKWWK